MDLSYGPEYDEFRQELRAFLERHRDDAPRGDGLRSAKTLAWQRLLIEHGYAARTIPREYGGYGAEPDILKSRIIAEEFAAARISPGLGGQGISMLVPVLLELGTEAQKQQFIGPTIRGELVWCQGYSEPGAGSDLASLRTRAELDGDDWVINGRKWFTSNGYAADFFIVMCRTADPDDPSGVNSKMTQIIVPKDTPGVNVVRGVPVWGKASSHCEIVYDNVRVPKENQLGGTGSGHQAAQDRLGAGRVYHCMNSIGAMWRAFDLMCQRLLSRQVHGGEVLAEKQFMQGFVADSYMDIQSARLMTIHCAEKMESGADPRTDISAIKIFVPLAYHRVVDRAIQVWGAAGVSGDLPLAGMYTGARTLRLADGPDEVHRILIAKNVLRRYKKGEGWDFGN